MKVWRSRPLLVLLKAKIGLSYEIFQGNTSLFLALKNISTMGNYLDFKALFVSVALGLG